MRPVVTAAEMRVADEATMRTVPHEVLVERAGLAAALGAVRLVPRVYGTPVVVICGPGSNGADGRVAARHLAARGAVVRVLEATDLPRRVEGAALVVDAAFGTGLSRRWDAPHVDPAVPVLAVDVPSGVDPDTGVASGDALRATRTVAMGALKRGHLLADGARLSGIVEVAQIGIDVVDAACALVDDDDLDAIPPLARDDHKWRRAVVVVAGSPGMLGAPALACDGALAVQAGMVLLCAPDVPRRREGPWPREVVRLASSAPDVEKVVVDALDRARALVMGPGLGRSARLQRAVVEVVRATREPIVLDADALHLVDADFLAARQDRGGSPIVLTPHDGEYAALFGAPPGTDRIAAAQHAARRTGCTVLLKGPTTVVASAAPPPGVPDVLAVTAGTPDLATPGSGDVLAGVIGGLLARGMPAHLAAALGAHAHGRAGAMLGPACRATKLSDAIASVLADRAARRREG
jgi:ADP-dependent NAD(P)H-hydrate dehydratase / NAD(P)H-hydrate epimerase